MSQVFVDFFAKTHLMTRLLVSVACPAILARDSWYASPATGPIDKYDPEQPPSMVIIHHSRLPPCSTTESCIVRMLELQRLHQRDRHWFDIGFNFAIGGDGSVYEGRGWNQKPAAVKNYNNKSINIAFLGDFSSSVPSAEMLKTARDLIDCGVRTGKISRDYKLVGYSEQDVSSSVSGPSSSTSSPTSDSSDSSSSPSSFPSSLFSHLQSWPHWSPMNLTDQAEPPTELKLALLVE
uniref:Peptidoglycan recognition protein n=1 Tax=Bemisia tabaci TaxID=7038 RepID=A0A1S5N4J5_BEMTA|nr:peptidoglycan recognition protein [Bemisia tabaci]